MDYLRTFNVTILACLLILSGCLGSTIDDTEAAEGDDSTSDGTTTIINNYYYNNTTTSDSSLSQDRTWYTSGGTFAAQWNDPNRDSSGYGCDGWSPSYDSSTGEYLGEECDSYSNADGSQLSDWNESNCTEMEGELIPGSSSSVMFGISDPYCKVEFTTINTSSGEVILIYQMDGGLSLSSSCGGVSTISATDASLTGREYWAVTGGAMDCSHTLYRDLTRDISPETVSLDIWSIVYAIQDVTVV